jgi:uncharacterized membrane protein YgcG
MLAQARDGLLDEALDTGMQEIAGAIDHPGSRLDFTPPVPLGWLVLLVTGPGAVLVAAIIWLLRGRDAPVPRIDDSVLLPAPPPGLTPAMASVLQFDSTAFALPAAVVDLASRGLFSMREGATAHSVEYVMADPARWGPAEAGLTDPERLLLERLRAAAANGVVTHVDLAKDAKLRPDFEKALGRAAAASPWYRSDPRRAVSWVSGLILVPFAGFIGFLVVQAVTVGLDTELQGLEVAGMLASWWGGMAAIGFIGSKMAARTPEGSNVLATLLAYRNTLTHELEGDGGVTDVQARVAPRLPWIGTPDALVVWSVALGLSKQVGAVISRSVVASTTATAAWQPEWYAGSPSSFGSFGTSIGSIGAGFSSSSGSGGGGASFGGGGGGRRLLGDGGCEGPAPHRRSRALLLGRVHVVCHDHRALDGGRVDRPRAGV